MLSFTLENMFSFEDNDIWEGLEMMSKRSQPLPWETFADECFSHGHSKEGLTFIDKISNNETKVNILCQYGCYDRAARIAKEKLKNDALYNEILYKANQ